MRLVYSSADHSYRRDDPGFSGFGSALINAPVLSLIWGPTIGVPIAVLVEVAPAIQLTPRAIKVAEWKSVWAFGIPALILLPAGTFILDSVPADEMRRAIGAIVLVVALILWSGWRYTGPRGTGPSIVVGLIGGGLAGATGVAGPPVILYLMSSTKEAAVIRANLIAYFTIILFLYHADLLAEGSGLPSISCGCRPRFLRRSSSERPSAKLFLWQAKRTFRNIALDGADPVFASTCWWPGRQPNWPSHALGVIIPTGRIYHETHNSGRGFCWLHGVSSTHADSTATAMYFHSQVRDVPPARRRRSGGESSYPGTINSPAATCSGYLCLGDLP